VSLVNDTAALNGISFHLFIHCLFLRVSKHWHGCSLHPPQFFQHYTFNSFILLASKAIVLIIYEYQFGIHVSMNPSVLNQWPKFGFKVEKQWINLVIVAELLKCGVGNPSHIMYRFGCDSGCCEGTVAGGYFACLCGRSHPHRHQWDGVDPPLVTDATFHAITTLAFAYPIRNLPLPLRHNCPFATNQHSIINPID